MTDDPEDDVDRDPDAGVPDSDPRHLDPAGDLADAVESGAFDIEIAEEQSREELEQFLERVDAGEFEPDPGLEATVRIVRALLDDADGDE